MNENTVVTGKVRFSYAHLFKPYSSSLNRPVEPGEASDGKYSLTILIPKSDTETYNKIQAAIGAAIDYATESRWNGAAPVKPPVPIHDGDGLRQSGVPYGDECKGHWVLTANANIDHQPEIVDASGQPILVASDVYSGCYGRVCLTFYGYNFNGRKGIGAGLGPVQKLEDGDPLGGGQRLTAAAVFGGSDNPFAL